MNTIDSGQYLDLGGLSQLRLEANQTPNNADTLQKVAEQFESLFVHMLLKSQRAANLGDPLFDSNALDTYRDFQDQQMSLELARGGGIGLADMLVQQLEQYVQVAPAGRDPAEPFDLDQYTIAPNRTAPRADTGVLAEPAPAPLAQAPSVTAPSFTPPEAIVATPVDASAPLGTTQTAHDADIAPPAAVTSAAPIFPLAGIPLATPRERSDDLESTRAATSPDWNSPEQFVQSVMPHARAAAESLGVDPRVLVAQAALETGWGRHVPHDTQTTGFNIFGIKADGRWDGDRVAWNTLEHDGVDFKPTRAQFRAYDGVEHAVHDYVDFIQSNPRYRDAVTLADDPRAYVYALQDAGYATDPAYADKVLAILQGERLNGAVASMEG
ncbi:MAG: flagellar assembly peptidoglycan hydrolase FlgJ [Pseudomonadota bacterium]